MGQIARGLALGLKSRETGGGLGWVVASGKGGKRPLRRGGAAGSRPDAARWLWCRAWGSASSWRLEKQAAAAASAAPLARVPMGGRSSSLSRPPGSAAAPAPPRPPPRSGWCGASGKGCGGLPVGPSLGPRLCQVMP